MSEHVARAITWCGACWASVFISSGRVYLVEYATSLCEPMSCNGEFAGCLRLTESLVYTPRQQAGPQDQSVIRLRGFDRQIPVRAISRQDGAVSHPPSGADTSRCNL